MDVVTETVVFPLARGSSDGDSDENRPIKRQKLSDNQEVTENRGLGSEAGRRPDSVFAAEQIDESVPRAGKGCAVVVEVPTSSDSTVSVRIQTRKYFPFSKKCVKVRYIERIPRLPGGLRAGGYMMQICKNDYKEEFELLPRSGQKVGSHSIADEFRVRRRLDKIYSEYYRAYQQPRFVELWKSELGSDLQVYCSGDLRWDTCYLDTAQKSLGSFGKYFGIAWNNGHTDMLKLNPYEAYFLADCGTMQVTSSQCVLGVEDVRALMESKVFRFLDRYAVFSKLLRVTRYHIKPYRLERKLEADGQSQPMRARMFCASYQRERSAFAPSLEFGAFMHKLVPGFASAIKDLEMAHEQLELPAQDIHADCERKMEKDDRKNVEPVLALVHGAGPSAIPVGSSQRPELKVNKQARIDSRGGSNRIDLAFYACEKSLEKEMPPAFDVAVTDYRNSNIPVSALFDVMERKRNPQIPLLMERSHCGQLIGYSMFLARVPEVKYSGRVAVQ